MAWDPKYPPAAQLPAGLAGMVAHENRLLSEPTELLDAKGVTFEDIHVRKEAGSALYDSGALTFSSEFNGTFSMAVDWFGYLATFKGTTGAAFVKAWSTTGAVASPGTTITLTLTVPAGGVPAGNLLVVSQSNNDSGACTVSVTDTGGNTYTEIHQTILREITVWFVRVVTPLAAGNTVTISLSGLTTGGTTVEAAAAVAEFTGIATSPFDQEATNPGPDSAEFGTAVAVGPTPAVAVPPAPSTPVLSVAVIVSFEEPGNHALTPGSNFTLHVEVGTTAAVLPNDDRTINVASRIDSVAPRITAIYDWYSDAERTPGGGSTISLTSGSTTVNRAGGDTFASLASGDRIQAMNETRIIDTVVSTTQLTTTEPWSFTTAATAYKTRPGNRLITATSAGNLFKEKPSSLTAGNIDDTTLQGSMATEVPGRFISGGKEAAAVNRKLFFYNGTDPIQVLSGDGTTTTDVATPATDWGTVTNPSTQPINGVIHLDRHLAWGNLNDPHRVYLSDPDDHEDFATVDVSFSLRFRSDVGDRIWTGASFQGVFFAFKYPRGVFYLDDTDLDVANWAVRTKSEAVGCAPCQYAVLPMDDDVLFMDPNAHFHLLSAVDALGGTRASDLTLRLGQQKWTRDNVNLKQLRWARSFWYPQKKLAVFYVPPTGSSRPSLAIKLDFSGVERGLPVRFSYSTRDIGDGVATRRTSDGSQERPVLAEGTSIYLLDQDARTRAGAAYTGQYQLPHLDLSHIDPSLRWRRKLFEHLELVMEPVAAGTLTVDVYVDGTVKQTLSFDATQKRQRKKLNVGDGYTISVRVTNSTASEDFKVLSHLVYFKVGNEDQSR